MTLQHIGGRIGMLLIIYLVLGYWATGKTIYANKIYIGSLSNYWFQRLMWGAVLGWLLIPVAIIRCIFHI